MELGTKVERLTFSTSCEIWQRISVCHRVQHMQLMPCASSMVSLGQLQHMRPWPSRSCIWCWLVLTMLTVCRSSTGLLILTLHPPSRHGMREKHTGNASEYTIKSGSQHLPPQFNQVLCNGSYKEELNFFLESWKNQSWVYIGQQTLYFTSGFECHWITSPAPRSVQSVVQLDHSPSRLLYMRKLTHGYSSMLSMPSSLRWHWCPYPDCVCCLCCSPTEQRKTKHGISVTSISSSLVLAAFLGLPAMHLFSGCGSISQLLG